jgi:hypothetical protein
MKMGTDGIVIEHPDGMAMARKNLEGLSTTQGFEQGQAALKRRLALQSAQAGECSLSAIDVVYRPYIL